jgi:hypothetical protein
LSGDLNRAIRSSFLMTNPLSLVVYALGIAGLLGLFVGIRALRRRRPLRFTIATLLGLLLLVSGALLFSLGLATRGYQALTRETVAARVTVTPGAPHRFTAQFRLPDGRERSFDLAGDQINVDAHILKWKPVVNILGLHTAYELDRVSGRYVELTQERNGPRTVYALSQNKRGNIYRLRRRFAFLAPLLDVSYGSGTFVLADRPATFEVRVSTTGLLIREVPSTP